MGTKLYWWFQLEELCIPTYHLLCGA